MLDVLSYVNERKASIKRHVELLKNKGKRVPRLAIVTDDRNFSANQSYIKSKTQFAMEVGIGCDVIVLKENEKFISNADDYDGIIVQFPFRNCSFAQFQMYVTEHVPPTKDVDGIGKHSLFNACTPLGIVRYLDHLRDTGLVKGHAVVNVVGYGGLVGEPLVKMLGFDNRYSVCVTRSTTPVWIADNFEASADIVVCATPQPYLKRWTSSRKIYIDCGCTLIDGKLIGNVSRDCYNEDAKITPVPNGVGRMTVLALFENVLDAYFIGDKYE